MIADVDTLLCRICVDYICVVDAKEYYVEDCCTGPNPADSIYLWLLNSGCTLDRDTQCTIDDRIKVVGSYDPFDETGTANCTISVNSVGVVIPSCNTITVS